MDDEKNNENSELLLPDIEAYLESISYGHPISIGNELERFSATITSYTNLSRENSNLVLRLFFEEIRRALLHGEIVRLRGFGSFFVSSPKLSGNRERIFFRFRPSPILRRKLNER